MSDTATKAFVPTHTVLAIAISILLAMTSAEAQSVAQPLERTDTFQVAFGMSLYGFDGCGDHRLGELYRRALLEKFNHCPFTDGANRRFHAWANDTSIHQSESLQRYLAEHGKLPDRPEGMKQTCQEQRETPAYLKIHEMLDRYASGEINADIIIPGGCDTPAGAP